MQWEVIELESNKGRESLYKLSGQLVDIFISDLFAKNNVDMDEVKKRISDSQREQLKQTVEELKGQVDDFLEKQTVTKTVSEEKNDTPSVNPLREAFMKKSKEKESSEEEHDN